MHARALVCALPCARVRSSCKITFSERMPRRATSQNSKPKTRRVADVPACYPHWVMHTRATCPCTLAMPRL